MSRDSIDLLILGGFLGSGKTTLLNHLLGRLEQYRIGVVVNDFGKLGVDASLVEHAGEGEVLELNGGQIFCSCISGNFVQSLQTLSEKQIDLILVESSGLAKPSALADIVQEARRASKEKLRYCGFVSVIDAERAPQLLEVVNAVEEQIVYADLIVINKTDLISAEGLGDLRRRIETMHPEVSIVETRRGELSPEALPQQPLSHEADEPSQYAGWGNTGRPKAVTWLPKVTLSPRQLEEAVRKVSESAYRIKGYVSTTEGFVYVSVSGSQISIEKCEKEGASAKSQRTRHQATHEREIANGDTPGEGIREGMTVIVPPRIITSKLFARAVEEATSH